MKAINRLEWLLHLTFWLVMFAAIFSLLNQVFYWQRSVLLSSKSILTWIVIAYLNAYYFIPKLFVRRRFAWYFLSAVLLVISSTLIAELIMGWLFSDFVPRFPDKFDLPTSNIPRRGPRPGPPIPFRFLAQFLMAVAILFVSSIYQLAKTFLEKERQSTQLEKEKIQHELNFLRSQINPHFLFNALNNLYATVQLSPEKSGEYILKLGEMLRYVLEECKKEKVQLTDEIAYIHNYIFFQKQKDEDLVNLDFRVHGLPSENYQLEPMILIALVENAFHHSRTTPTEKQWIDIDLNIKDAHFFFQIKNNLPVLGHAENTEGLGIGLKNIKRRLALKYPNTHQLLIEQKADYFSAKLTINI